MSNFRQHFLLLGKCSVFIFDNGILVMFFILLRKNELPPFASDLHQISHIYFIKTLNKFILIKLSAIMEYIVVV